MSIAKGHRAERLTNHYGCPDCGRIFPDVNMAIGHCDDSDGTKYGKEMAEAHGGQAVELHGKGFKTRGEAERFASSVS